MTTPSPDPLLMALRLRDRADGLAGWRRWVLRRVALIIEKLIP